MNPVILRRTIANHVRACRLRLRWSQEELAERAGIKLATYRYFEQTARISLDRLCCIAAALGRTSDLQRIFEPLPVTSLKELPDDEGAKLPQRGKTQK
ncbi:MAG: helix-turn-helix transcriptional regulator [Verrucomicrobia bacterium]|nr:helix-turn-helix transcriptional regulator [Verrucomicrobiota bacterium]